MLQRGQGLGSADARVSETLLGGTRSAVGSADLFRMWGQTDQAPLPASERSQWGRRG